MPAKTDVIEYALRYIYRYQKTERELIIQLRKKRYTETEVEKAIAYLKDRWYVNDRKFTKEYIEYHLISRWKPIIYVKNKLYEKWIDFRLTKQIIEEKFDEINHWIQLQITKEIENYKNKWLNPLDIIQKITRKWYTMSQVKYVINNKEEI